MKAVYLNQDIEELNELISIKGDKFHHMANVLRVKLSEKILVITNSKGKGLFSEIIDISKKELTLKVIEKIEKNKSFNIDIAFGVPKKDAFSEIVKASVEMGVNKIIPLHTEYSWHKYEYNDRVEKLIVSALEQSNNLFYPDLIKDKTTLQDIDFESYDSVIYFSSNPNLERSECSIKGKVLFIIGPEGGMSPSEEEFLFSKASILNLETPILRAKTAVSFAFGLVYAVLKGLK